MIARLSNKSFSFNRIEIIFLYVLLYCIGLLYVHQFFKIAGKPRWLGQDETFYYVEAKGLSLHNMYQTPISYDGYTSAIGNFGAHGVAYPIKDGWLSKIFFQAADPPMVWNNLFTLILTILFILFFKSFSLNVRLKIALVTLTNHIVFSSTLSYTQETIHLLLTIIALRTLYHLYQQDQPSKSKYLYYYLLIVLVGTIFRYSWFIWGLALLPLASDFKSFVKWSLVICVLTAIGLFSFRYLVAPWPYLEGNRIANVNNNLSFGESINIFKHTFTENARLFFTPDASFVITCMRYLFFTMLLACSWLAFVRRTKIMIGCTLVIWAYFFACIQFSFLTVGNDLRLLVSLNLVFSFILIGTYNSLIFYPIIVLQLYFLPGVITKQNEELVIIDPSSEKTERTATYSKIKDIVRDSENDNDITIIVPIQFVYFQSHYFIDFPLVTQDGKPIHYSVMIGGFGYSTSHPPNYIFSTNPVLNSENHKLVYSDKWMSLYEIINNKKL